MNAPIRLFPRTSQAIRLLLFFTVVAFSLSADGVWPTACAQEEQAGPQQEANPASGDASELCVRKFDINELRRRLATECGLQGVSADQWVRQHAEAVLGVSETAEQSERLDSEARKESFVIESDYLVVTASQEGVERIEKSLERIRETGIAQIVMRLSVYQGPAAEMQQLKIRWAHVDTSTSIATAQDNKSPASPVATAFYDPSHQPGGVTLAGMMLHKQHPMSLESTLATKLNKALMPSHTQKDSRWIEASSIVELGTPVLYTMLAPDEVQAVVEQAGASESINAVSSTLMAVHNGNPTQINNVIERPFVTAVHPRRIVTDGESTLVFEPRTKVYPEGFQFIVRPTLIDAEQIRLTCVAEQFSVQKVRTMDIPVAGEAERTIRVQMPTAAKSSVHAQLAIPRSFALALSTESLDADGKPLTTLFVCQCGSKQLRDDNRE